MEILQPLKSHTFPLPFVNTVVSFCTKSNHEIGIAFTTVMEARNIILM